MSFYPRLPDELKLKIWEEAIVPEHGGVQHFKIGFDRPRTYEQTLTVYPQRDAKGDASSWVGFWGLSVASRLSWDLVKKSDHGNRVLFWQKMPPQKIKTAAYMPELPTLEERTPQEQLGEVGGVPSDKIPKPTKALINGDKDIICFTLVGSDFDSTWLDWANNHQRFRQLTHVAFNFHKPEVRPSDWITRPFGCLCGRDHSVQAGYAFCPKPMARFLRIFENLQTFYFTISIVACRLTQPSAEPLPHGTKRKRGGQAAKVTGSQLVAEAMDKFKALAQEKGLSVFHDRKKTYYELDDSGMPMIKESGRLREVIQGLADSWHHDTHIHAGDPECPWYNPRATWGDVKFKVLVYRGG